MDNRIKVERGIRYREHPTRKHGVPRHLDRYYVIRLAVDGIMRQEALGWESEGITLEKARLELAKLREARRTAFLSKMTLSLCLARSNSLSRCPVQCCTLTRALNTRTSPISGNLIAWRFSAAIPGKATAWITQPWNPSFPT